MDLSLLRFLIKHIASYERRSASYRCKSKRYFRERRVSLTSVPGISANCALSHASRALFLVYVILDMSSRKSTLKKRFHWLMLSRPQKR